MKPLGLVLAALASPLACADTHRQVLDQLVLAAGSGASAAQGERLFRMKSDHGEAASCSACHTDDPKAAGRHVRTHKAIEPLAPVANPARFTDTAKVEKWFGRNCKEVLDRACSAQEKADFAAYMISVR